MIFQQTLLSALIESLKFSILDDNALSLLVSAYPDLKPWQVKKYCTDSGSENSLLYYYSYLSLLLDHIDGNKKARRDRTLVNVSETCNNLINSQVMISSHIVAHKICFLNISCFAGMV